MGFVEKIIDLCGRRRFLVLVLTALFVGWGLYSTRKAPLDALPDLSDNQVIIATEWMGRSPNLIEDQITYPLVTAFLAAPDVKVVRGLSMFGMSFVYVIFEDDTDLYFARTRVLEYLAKIQGKLPQGVTPQIGPDATSVGWVFEYALVSRCEPGQTDCPDLQELRSFQDWYLRYQLSSVPGVAEVASVGGFQKQYQIELNPTQLKSYNLSIADVISAVKMSNGDVGGGVIEVASHEYAVRGRGYIQKKEDLEEVVVSTDARGTPVRLKDIAKIQIGGAGRRGFVELDGEGEAVGGIIVMRYGENALDVIERVKQKIEELKPSFPKGVELEVTYDRAPLIEGSIATLRDNLLQVMAVVVLTIIVFLFHFRSSLVAAITLPVAVVLSFIPMYYLGITTNIMSLAGIIIAVGDMVDSAVVLIENAHKKLEREGHKKDRIELVLEAARELGPSAFGSLLVLTISFLPIFVLEAQEGRLFTPLAFTKSFSMAFAAVLSITLVPALMVFFIKGKIKPEMKNPINRVCISLYRPMLKVALRARHALLLVTAALFGITLYPWTRLGSEFMPPLEEGSILFMPVTVPGLSLEESKRLVELQDKIFKSFPEVDKVFGKAGRAETATDPAPLSMFETVVLLKPKDQWREGMTKEKLLEEMEHALHFPGLQNAWTMPIKARVDMLATGIRTPVGVKIYGKDLKEIAAIGEQLEGILKNVPGTRSVYAERELGGFFLDFIPDRAALARYGLRVMDVLQIVETAVGGVEIDTTIEGRERYSINIRYPRELRDDPEALARILVPVMSTPMSTSDAGMGGGTTNEGPQKPQAQIPLGQLGRFEVRMGAPMIKSEAGSLTGWVYIDVQGRDIGSYVKDAKEAVAKHLPPKPGYTLQWTGQYEFMARVAERMQIVVPLTLLLVFGILYLNFGGVTQVLLVMLSVPFAAVGSIWTLYWFDFNTSIAVWVGMIALIGVATETASMMLVYLDQEYKRRKEANELKSLNDLISLTVEAATMRVRPLLMTVVMNIVGLLPVMFDTGIGSDIAKRIAAPLWGGLVSLTILTLIVLPALYVVWRSFSLRRAHQEDPPASLSSVPRSLE